MKKFLRFFAVICSASLLLVLCGCSEEVNIPSPTDRFYINDYAGVIDSKDADEIFSAGAELDRVSGATLGKETGAQVVAVTVGTTEGEEISDYALRLGREWGVGDKEDNNGVVILLATEDREVYIAVGYGLEGALPDSKTGRIIDNYGIDYFAENEFSKGMLNLYNAIVREVYAEYDIEVPSSVLVPENYKNDVDLEDVGISWGIIILIVALCIIYLRLHGFFIYGPSFGFSSFSGSGWGRGSGGGFSGFSGGGGSFGGGGAGRGF